MTKKKLIAEDGFLQQINSNLDAKNLDKYYLSSNFKKIKKDVKNNLNFFHLIFPPSPNFPELHNLLATSEITIDIIDITESRSKSNKNH